MALLPKNTPKMTKPIKAFTVTFTDDTTRKIVVGEGEGFFREEVFKGSKESFITYEAYIASKGTKHDPQLNTGTR